ncbi:MAG: hypothetical protein KGM47_11900, partial [Acidobacteriota bacterium]|nr:hypothetical protein [Acidobacteriota bacterium]
RSVSFAGTGRVQLEASTSEDLFPNSSLVIPAGSDVDGWGQESAGGWTLHWSQISIRGSHARISAENHAATVSGLQGQRMTVITK